MVTPPRTAVVSSHVDVFSAADHSKPSASRPVTHGGRRRPHVREEEVGAAERAMWRRELAAVQQALAESEARLQRLQAAHAAQAAAAHAVPRAVHVHRAGPARLSLTLTLTLSLSLSLSLTLSLSLSLSLSLILTLTLTLTRRG